MPDGIIYLDYHSTTPVDPRVLEGMLPYFAKEFGNAGSLHAYGDVARAAVEHARGQVAATIGADPTEIVFTSGATESNNLAIRGIADRTRRRGNHLVSVATEHRAILDPLRRLAERGFEVTLLEVVPHPAANAGWLDPLQVEAALRDDTCLVSVMLANNEIGVIHPIRQIAEICHRRGIPLHCDATQAVGKIEVDVRELDVDLLSFSAHKVHGPKGVGGLYVRRREASIRLEPLFSGGGQELGRRSGTLNVPGIVGMGLAFEFATNELAGEAIRLTSLRNELARLIMEQEPSTRLIGPTLDAADDRGRPLRLPHNLNLMLPGLDGQAVMLAAPGLAISSGATCSAAEPEPSHVLRGLGLSVEEAHCCLRFGLGRETTSDQMVTAAEMIHRACGQLRELNPQN